MGKLRLRPKVDRKELRRRIHAVLVDKYPCGEDFSERGARWFAVDAILDAILPLFAVDVGAAMERLERSVIRESAIGAVGLADRVRHRALAVLLEAGFEVEEEGTEDGFR